MSAVLRWTAFMLLTMAIDVLCGVIGGAIAGDAGMKFGLRLTSNFCFGFVAMLVAVHGWRAPLKAFHFD